MHLIAQCAASCHPSTPQVASLIEHMKRYYPIEARDMILTGTPAGVGALKEGDVVTAWCASGDEILSKASWRCTAQ